MCHWKIARRMSSGRERMGCMAASYFSIVSAQLSFTLCICSKIACMADMQLSMSSDTDRVASRPASKECRTVSSTGFAVDKTVCNTSGSLGISNAAKWHTGHSSCPFGSVWLWLNDSIKYCIAGRLEGLLTSFQVREPRLCSMLDDRRVYHPSVQLCK